MMYNSLSDQEKENSDLFTTLHKVRNMNPMVPGVYANLAAVANGQQFINVPLKLRIPLSSFLTLFNLRFFPNWSGKLSIEVYPSYRNLVICPVIPEQLLSEKEFIAVYKQDFGEWRPGFVNINQKAKNRFVRMEEYKRNSSTTRSTDGG